MPQIFAATEGLHDPRPKRTRLNHEHRERYRGLVAQQVLMVDGYYFNIVSWQYASSDSGALVVVREWETDGQVEILGKVDERKSYNPEVQTTTRVHITGATYAIQVMTLYRHGAPIDTPMVWEARYLKASRDALMAELLEYRCMSGFCFTLLLGGMFIKQVNPEFSQPWWLASHAYHFGYAVTDTPCDPQLEN